MEIQYLATDLDLEPRDYLSPLIEDLGGDVLAHLQSVKGLNHASIRLAYDSYAGPNESVCGFCNLIENLSPEARKIWDHCCTRVIDLGFESGTSPNRYWFEFRPETIARVAAIQASLAISIYPLKHRSE